MAQKEFGTAICSVFKKMDPVDQEFELRETLCLQGIGKYNGTTLSVTSPWFGSELTLLPYVVHGGDSVSSHQNTHKPVSRLGEQTGLPSRQTGLQADLPGLGFDLHPNPSPSPNKPVGAGASPFGKPKSALSSAGYGSRAPLRSSRARRRCHELTVVATSARSPSRTSDSDLLDPLLAAVRDGQDQQCRAQKSLEKKLVEGVEKTNEVIREQPTIFLDVGGLYIKALGYGARVEATTNWGLVNTQLRERIEERPVRENEPKSILHGHARSRHFVVPLCLFFCRIPKELQVFRFRGCIVRNARANSVFPAFIK
ncbi:hypothetical protein DFH09DRAFT_1075253 [Mycena vulgaris]|nr:hypothetical protein DFH09DRAFT_1075253 [Mycena vulgaris]